MKPITKRVKDTNQKLLEESKATTKAPDDINEKFPMITAPGAIKSVTDPQPKISLANARADKAFHNIEEEKKRPRSDWYNKK